MCTTCLPTVPVLVATARCQYQRGRETRYLEVGRYTFIRIPIPLGYLPQGHPQDTYPAGYLPLDTYLSGYLPLDTYPLE